MTIKEIKQKLSIMTVLSHYDLQPNRNHMLVCPFHEDSKPSMRVYPDTNTVYCFAGSCRVSNLDVIDFIMQKEGCSKHEAILKAGSLAGGEQVTIRRVVEASEPETDLVAAYNIYRGNIKKSKAAQEYCLSRALDWERYEIGYKSNKSPLGKTESDRWGRGCIIFPMRDELGKIVSFYGRSIKSNGHYYMRGRTGLYPRHPLPDTRTLVLCESVIDAATIRQGEWALDTYAILALYGTNGLTVEHWQAIRKLEQLQEIIFALDGDEAGRKATRELSTALAAEFPGVQMTTMVLPEGSDVNSLAAGSEDMGRLFRGLFQDRAPVAYDKPAPVSPPPTSSALVTDNPYNLIYTTQTATYYIKGGLRYGVRDLDSLKVSLVVQGTDSRKSRQKFDLYEDKQIVRSAHAIAERLSLRPDLVEIDLSKLADELEGYRETLQTEDTGGQVVKNIAVSDADRARCLDFLKAPKLLQRINELIGRAGVAGEDLNRLLLFVVASSYAMPDTLHALIQGSSGTGKTRLLQVISELMPSESVKRYTRVTDGSFYNQPEYFFKNKLLCFEDIDGLKEEALLAVRELQSNEVLISSTSLKDEQGNIRGGEVVVRGPIASISCTTRAEVYEDNISRCFVVAVDESKEQSLRIIGYQNDKAAGVIDKAEEKRVRIFLQNCMRLLRSLEVINPFANRIHLPKEAHKIRRLNELYQSFVRQITLLNQYQRKRDARGRVISTPEDLQAACDILFESIVLKVDELDGSLRQFFEGLKSYVGDKGKGYEFNRFELRKATGVSKTQQHRYLSQLVELEYVRQFGFANRGYRYKIAHWDDQRALRSQLKEHLNKQLTHL